MYSIFFSLSNTYSGTRAAQKFSMHEFMLWTVNTSVANTVSMLAHKLLRILAIYPTVAIIFFVFI